MHKDIAEFNRHAQEGDPQYRVGWLRLDKAQYRIDTGYFAGIVQWEEVMRDWGIARFQRASLMIPQEQIRAFWETGEVIPVDINATVKKEERRFPLLLSLQRQGEQVELAQIFVWGLQKAWLAKAEQIPSFRDCPECPEMVKIPSSNPIVRMEYHLGEGVILAASLKAEGPLNITIGKYEVNQGQWKAMMGSNPSHFFACGDDCPVENISWNDVQEFIEKINQRTGKRYRLPSRIEWMAACLAGQRSQFCGSDNVNMVAWFDENLENKTHQVGTKNPNDFGLYDMSGNVEEWVQDCYHEDCRNGNIGLGGSFTDSRKRVMAGTGGQVNRNTRVNSYGFRLVRDLFPFLLLEFIIELQVAE